jgi:flagellar M-ring protein FliF
VPASPAPSGAAPAATGSAPPVPATAPATPAGSPANTLSNAVAAMTGTGRSSEITNYEVSRTTRHTVTGQGQIARLSVAVIVDDERVVTRAADGTTSTSTKPWDAQELRRLQGLVAAAVGLDQQRGDQLTVENISFDAVPAEPDPAPAGCGAQVMDVARVYGPSAARGLGVVLIASFALFGILRPLARRATAIAATPALPAPSATAARLPTVSEMEGQFDAETGGGGQKRLPGLSKRVAKLASEEPEQLARIVRGWMAEDERA